MLYKETCFFSISLVFFLSDVLSSSRKAVMVVDVNNDVTVTRDDVQTASTLANCLTYCALFSATASQKLLYCTNTDDVGENILLPVF